MIKEVALSQTRFLKSKTNSELKTLGQFFTDDAIATYMAQMIKPVDCSEFHILDAGAGAGILTIAAAFRCLEMNINHIHAVLYEIDENAIPLLKENMEYLAQIFSEKSRIFSFDIFNKDFVLSRPDKNKENFHLAIINPPYFKYSSKSSPYSDSTTDLFKGNPNIYASFMAVAASCLKVNGQMVVIVPRSFKNGLYFKGFRNYINQTLSLDKMHIFQSRSALFKELSVLQENIICSYTKRSQSKTVEICTSAGFSDLKNVECNSYPANLIIDKTNDHQIIRIPESLYDANILKTVSSWPSTFSDNNYFISTGPVVEHRTQSFITKPNNNADSVPLFRMHNIKAFKATWTGTHKKDASFKLLDNHQKHTSINQSYLILKRFSSKDEKRRLVAGIHNPDNVKSDYIALENHLNYIGIKDNNNNNLEEIYGLAALFNSTFMDRYFRCISGNTQVNATEIRLLKMPERKTIKNIGAELINNKELDQLHVESVVNNYLGLMESI